MNENVFQSFGSNRINVHNLTLEVVPFETALEGDYLLHALKAAEDPDSDGLQRFLESNK